MNGNNGTITIRVQINPTWIRLNQLVQNRKQKNMTEIGKSGDASFDTIINELLDNNQPNGEKEETSDGGEEK